MTTFGQKGEPMTTFRQKDQDAIGQKPQSELNNFILVIYHGSY